MADVDCDECRNGMLLGLGQKCACGRGDRRDVLLLLLALVCLGLVLVSVVWAGMEQVG